MAEKIKENQFEEKGVNPFNAPVPGESLTASPSMQKGWERPPEYTDQQDAMESVYMELTSEDKLFELIKLIDSKQPLDEIAQIILYRGYTQGMYSTDLMLLLIEPTLYLLIAIADYADIKDYVLYEGEEDDPDGAIYGDDVEPVSMDDDDDKEKATQPKDESEITEYEEPSSDSLSSSLLSKVKKELPSKIKNLQENK
jgi:hypothetical protein